MITVSQLVEEYVTKSPFLEDGLLQGLINYSALARELKPEFERRLYKSLEVGSIVMALKRLRLKNSLTLRKLHAVLEKITDLSMRTNLVALTFINSPSLFDCQSRLLNVASKTPNSFLTITHGIYETSIFLSRNLVDDAGKIFKNEKSKLYSEGLSSITLVLPKEAVDTPGLHYSVFKKLFMNGVNVFDTVTSFTELTIFLNNEDIDRAFSILKKLSQ